MTTRTVEMRMAHALDTAPVSVPTFDEVYARHVAFVWRIARVFGVADAALEDTVQEVFLVVHRRLGEFEGRSAITTWLFEITRRVALAARRRVGRTEPLEAEPTGTADTFAEASRTEAAAIVAEIMDGMDEDQRIVFALVELEQLTVPEVAAMVGVKLNTAYSRLRLARHAFEAAVRRRREP